MHLKFKIIVDPAAFHKLIPVSLFHRSTSSSVSSLPVISSPSEIIQLGSPILKSTIPRKKYQDFLQGEALTVSFDIIVNYPSDSKYDFSMGHISSDTFLPLSYYVFHSVDTGI